MVLTFTHVWNVHAPVLNLNRLHRIIHADVLQISANLTSVAVHPLYTGYGGWEGISGK